MYILSRNDNYYYVLEKFRRYWYLISMTEISILKEIYEKCDEPVLKIIKDIKREPFSCFYNFVNVLSVHSYYHYLQIKICT